jgi:glyoxylase-like metal-dependent hydrolase (beta-lactamase superfamily II)
MYRSLSARQPKLVKVHDRVYSALDYAISNVLFVVTDESVVVIDTTESMRSARAALNEFRKVCSLPISHIIYTHFHGDHIRGAKTFHNPEARVISQEGLPLELAKMRQLLPFRKMADDLQFGLSLEVKDRGISLDGHAIDGYVPPDVTFGEEYRFEHGGVVFELYHTQGETHDHLMVWLPNEGILFPGDLFYSSFPMLNNPMKPERPILDWADSLKRMQALRPKFLLPSHSQPREGSAHIHSVLTNYERAIRYVHDETVRRINRGFSLEEIREQLHLPDDLARLPYLHQGYGTIRWAVNGVYRHYTGWYDLNPATLKPAPRHARDRVLLEVSGGARPLIKRARKALSAGHPQLALELVDVVMNAQPGNESAHALWTEALEHLGTSSRNGVERNIYLAAARRPSAWPRRRIPTPAQSAGQSSGLGPGFTTNLPQKVALPDR